MNPLICIMAAVTLALAASLFARPAADATYDVLRRQGIECDDISLMVGDHQVNTIIASPPREKLHADPVLLLVIGRANVHLIEPPLSDPAQYVLSRGHRAVCLTVPKIESSLEVFRDSVLAGERVVESTINDARAVVAHCIENNWARPGRIIVIGVSRNGYLAFRIMAGSFNSHPSGRTSRNASFG